MTQRRKSQVGGWVGGETRPFSCRPFLFCYVLCWDLLVYDKGIFGIQFRLKDHVTFT